MMTHSIFIVAARNVNRRREDVTEKNESDSSLLGHATIDFVADLPPGPSITESGFQAPTQECQRPGDTED